MTGQATDGVGSVPDGRTVGMGAGLMETPVPSRLVMIALFIVVGYRSFVLPEERATYHIGVGDPSGSMSPLAGA